MKDRPYLVFLLFLRSIFIISMLPQEGMASISVNYSSIDADSPEAPSMDQGSATYFMNELPEISDEEINIHQPISSTTTNTLTARIVSSDPWPWILFFIRGNASIAAQRLKDLSTYLRLNLAARLDADYNDVVVNRVILNHEGFLANISIEPDHLVGIGAVGLHDLSKGNVTLLQLSGQEYYVEKILKSEEFFGQRIVDLDVTSVDAEVAIYGAVGAIFLFLFLVVLLGLVFHGPCKGSSKDLNGQESYNQPPVVIYTEELAKEINESTSSSAKWQRCQIPEIHISEPLYAVPDKKKKNLNIYATDDVYDVKDAKEVDIDDVVQDAQHLFERQSAEKTPNFYGY